MRACEWSGGEECSAIGGQSMNTNDKRFISALRMNSVKAFIILRQHLTALSLPASHCNASHVCV